MRKIILSKILIGVTVIATVAIIALVVRNDSTENSAEIKLVRYISDNEYDIRDLDTLEELSDIIIKGIVRDTEIFLASKVMNISFFLVIAPMTPMRNIL